MTGPSFILTAALTFVAVVCTLIVLHELGHYLAARAFGLKAKVFSVGMGPEIAGFTDRHGTRWKIAPIPLGGYVQYHGEMHPGFGGKDDDADHKESFAKLARWKRAVVIFAGPFANILVTAVIFGGLFLYSGKPEISKNIMEVEQGSPAAAAGIHAGDKLMQWDGRKSDGSQDFIRYVKINPGHTIALDIESNGKTAAKDVTIKRVNVQDRWGNKAQIGRVGIVFESRMRPITGPIDLLRSSTIEAFSLFGFQARTMWQMAKGERSMDEITGPIRLAKFSGEQFLTGWIPLIYFTAMLSIAIAFMNLLPIPGLDGGYLALYAIEGVTRRDIPRRTFGHALKFGYACVAVLTVFAFTNDIRFMIG